MIEVPDEFIAFLKTEYDRCADTDLEDERTTAIDRYNGEPYGDEEEGSSQVVSKDTAETVDYMVISILRTLVSGDRVVEFLHQDTKKAAEATETIMHILMDEQDGYRILHDWLKAGLLEKNAVAMVYAEAQPPRRRMLNGVSAIGLIQAEQQGLQIIEAEQTGEGEEGPIFNVVGTEERAPKFCVAAVPNEEHYCSPDARTLMEAALNGRRVRKTISDLVKEGVDRDEAESLPAAALTDNMLSQARDEDRRWFDRAKTVWWHEEYVRFDLNEDGVDELLYVKRSADYKVFAIDEVQDEDEQPFEDWCPFPMPHRRIGQSLADKVMDIERINTVITRQSLDGIYLTNRPSTWLHEDSISDNTVDDLLTVRAGRMVRWKGQVEPKERQGAFDPSAGFQMLEYMERKRESRTGITRLNMGLDESTLNETAKGQSQLIAKGEQVEEYIARNFANAFARLIAKLARLLRTHGKPMTVPIDGKYVEVDPSQWPEDMVARSRVGLGASRKDQRLQAVRELIGMQSAAFEAGLSIVDEQKFFNSAKAFIADSGLGVTTEYFNEPPKDEQGNPLPKEEAPDPEAMKVQAEMQMQQAKLQGEQQIAAAKLEGDQQAQAFKLQAEREAAMQRQQLDREQAEFEANLAVEKMNREHALELQRMEREAELEERRMQREERVAVHSAGLAEKAQEAKLSQNRAGGALDK